MSVVNFLRTAYQAVKGEQVSALAFRKHMKEQMDRLSIDDAMVNRYVNQGFSGGEKKRNEVLQLAVLRARDRDPGRDRLGPRHRLAEARGRGRERAGRAGPRRAADHALPAHAELHHPRPGPRDDAGAYREVRRPRARARARGEGVRGHPRGARARGRSHRRGRERTWRAEEQVDDRSAWAGSTSRRSGATSRSSRAPWASTRSSTSTARRRRRSRTR